MAKLEVGERAYEFEMPKAGDVLKDMLACKGIIKAAATRHAKADELIDAHKISEASPILVVLEELEYDLGDRLQKLFFAVVPDFKDGFPDDMTVEDAGKLLQQFAREIMLGGDRVKN